MSEWAGAMGDLGTLIPFLTAYIVILKMNAGGIFLAFGFALVAVGLIYRTPFPIQPMKAIGAAAVSHTAIAAGLNGTTVAAAALTTGLLWLVLAATGLASRLSQWIPRAALLGVILGLGYSFMLEGLRYMSIQPWMAGALLAVTLLMVSRPKLPTMLCLMLIGFVIALMQAPSLIHELTDIQPSFHLPVYAWEKFTPSDLWVGFILLTLPQLPLTFGNAFISITEENNKLFPDRPVSQRAVAWSTGFMNLGASALGAVPMCHGAGGMAAHVMFGARTGGASIILGGILLLLGFFFSASIETIFKLFPQSVLGVMLFMAGLQLALGSRDSEADKTDRFVIIATAAIAIWNVGLAVVFGVTVHHFAKKGWLKF